MFEGQIGDDPIGRCQRGSRIGMEKEDMPHFSAGCRDRLAIQMQTGLRTVPNRGPVGRVAGMP
jgi:hypothetical protein